MRRMDFSIENNGHLMSVGQKLKVKEYQTEMDCELPVVLRGLGGISSYRLSEIIPEPRE